MKNLFIDIETYNAETNLQTQGLYRYAEGAEIILVGYAVDDGPVKVWEPGEEMGPKVLVDSANDVNGEYRIIAHNAAFERTVFAMQSYKIFTTLAEHDKWHCTMAQALLHGLPGGLQALSEIFKLPFDEAKDKDGRNLVHTFCKPLSDGKRATRETHPAEWEKFKEYCRKDIEAERALYKKMPSWNCNDFEREVYEADRRINDRGFLVDVAFAEAAVKILATEKQARDNKVWEATGGGVTAATRRDKMLEHLLDVYGISLPDMTNSTLTRRMEDPDTPPAVKELIALRLESAGTAPKKYAALLKSVSSDGRLRGTLQYCGASRTGRWTGRIFQPQNLPRPAISAAAVETAIAAVKGGCSDLLYDCLTPILSSALRGVIVAPEGKKLVVADLSSIEGRVLAWLAGEKWKIKAYAEYDKGGGFDMYVQTYARTFRKKPEDVTKKERQLGKVLELALGYGGGVGAFISFANIYHIDLAELSEDMTVFSTDDRRAAKGLWDWSEEEGKTFDLDMQTFMACECIKKMWRDANPAITKFWGDLEQGVKIVAEHPAASLICSAGDELIEIDKSGKWLRIELPSGRYLCYGGIEVDPNRKIRYLGVNPYTRKWSKLEAYGGKLAENVTQAVSRDIFAHGMVEAEAAGYNVVLSVHDELITEVPDTKEYTAEGLSKIMSSAPEWAEGLPLAAAGFEAKRYRKD